MAISSGIEAAAAHAQGAASLGGAAGASGLFGSAGTFLGAAVPWIGPGIMAATLASQLIGRGRKQADIFVQSAQDPISKRMATLVSEVERRRVAGTLTAEEAQYALDAFIQQEAEFEDIATQFESLGAKQATVVRQARQTTTPIYGAWREALQEHLRAVTPQEAAAPTPTVPEDPPSMTTILSP